MQNDQTKTVGLNESLTEDESNILLHEQRDDRLSRLKKLLNRSHKKIVYETATLGSNQSSQDAFSWNISSR